MRSRLVVLVAVAIATFSSASCAHRLSSRAAELHRTVFATVNPGHPYTRASVEAQIELAQAYAKGRGTDRDEEFGCSLAQGALAATELVVPDGQLRLRSERTFDELCAQVADRDAAERLTACPVFGVKPKTLDAGGGARLTLSPTGVRLTNASGVHDNLWIVGCGDIIMSPRLVRAKAPPGALYVPTFLEFFVWHEMFPPDGRPTSIGSRLEWKVMEVVRWGLPQADGAVLRHYPGKSVWPIRPVPRAIARGATLRLLPSGEVHWHFEGAPEFGTGTVGILGGPP